MRIGGLFVALISVVYAAPHAINTSLREIANAERAPANDFSSLSVVNLSRREDITATVTFTSGTSSSPTQSPSDMQHVARYTVRDLLQKIATEIKINLTVKFTNDISPNEAVFGAETGFTFTAPLEQCLNKIKKRGLPLYRTGRCSGTVVIGKEKGVIYGADGKQLYRQA